MKTCGTARIGSDMDIRYLTDGTPVGQVSLAFRLGIKDKEGNYKTQWISASLFGKRVEILAPYLTKGSLHAFHLRDVHLDEFTGKDGNVRVSLKAIIDDVELCGSKQAQIDERVKLETRDNSISILVSGQNPPYNSLQIDESNNPSSQQAAHPIFDNFDDDIPF